MATLGSIHAEQLHREGRFPGSPRPRTTPVALLEARGRFNAELADQAMRAKCCDTHTAPIPKPKESLRWYDWLLIGAAMAIVVGYALDCLTFWVGR